MMATRHGSQGRSILLVLLGVASVLTSCNNSATGRPSSPEGEGADNRPASVIPNETTPADRLDFPGYRHFEVLRIDRDFGEPPYQIVLDAWTPAEGATAAVLTEIRLWWIKLDKSLERGPFSDKTRRHFTIDYEQPAPDLSLMHLRSGRKHFTFTVELDPQGVPRAYGDMIDETGQQIRHCRADHGQLEARRLFGAPIGIRRLVIDCVDAAGVPHRGDLSSSD